ncbi:MAG: hypothetical protein ACYDGN_08435 [Acidimicrobiales bacterium]
MVTVDRRDGRVKSLIDRLTRAALRRGLRNGLLAGDGKWVAVGAVAWLVRLLMKKKEPDTVVEKLSIGQSIVVTNLGPRLKGRGTRRGTRDRPDLADRVSPRQ